MTANDYNQVSVLESLRAPRTHFARYGEKGEAVAKLVPKRNSEFTSRMRQKLPFSNSNQMRHVLNSIFLLYFSRFQKFYPRRCIPYLIL